MNEKDPGSTEFERRMQQVLAASVASTDSRVRSRLTQARYAALEQASRGNSLWRPFMAVPAGGAVAAAVLVAVVLWSHQETGSPPDGAHAALENLELLVDDEAFSLVAEGDGAFYEWAASQIELADQASG